MLALERTNIKNRTDNMLIGSTSRFCKLKGYKICRFINSRLTLGQHWYSPMRIVYPVCMKCRDARWRFILSHLDWLIDWLIDWLVFTPYRQYFSRSWWGTKAVMKKVTLNPRNVIGLHCINSRLFEKKNPCLLTRVRSLKWYKFSVNQSINLNVSGYL